MPLPKIQARLQAIADRLENSKISADEVPAILDAGVDLLEAAITAAMDKRFTISEVATLWDRVSDLRAVIAAARQD